MGGKQRGFGDYDQRIAIKQTEKEKFLVEMDKVVPWQPLIDLIDPLLPQVRLQGRATALCTGEHVADPTDAALVRAERPAMEDALIEVPTMRRFAGID